MATYRGQSSGWQLGVIIDRGLARGARGVPRRRRRCGGAREDQGVSTARGSDSATQLKVERDRALDGVDQQLDDAVARVNLLLDKLAASNGTITLINGVLTYVPTGPSPIALLADAADLELSRLLVTPAASWRPTRSGSPREHALADGARTGQGARRRDVRPRSRRTGTTTPPNVVHAMLFATAPGRQGLHLRDRRARHLRLLGPHQGGLRPDPARASRTSRAHSCTSAIPVAPDALRPGDLLTYGPDGSEHVTMYIGDGLVVEAKGRGLRRHRRRGPRGPDQGLRRRHPHRPLTRPGVDRPADERCCAFCGESA